MYGRKVIKTPLVNAKEVRMLQKEDIIRNVGLKIEYGEDEQW